MSVSKKAALERLRKFKMSEFEFDVLRATLDIPRGKTRTYKQIAEAIGKPKAFRAVGTALKNNPLPIVIPCHRVVRSDGDIGSYSGSSGRGKRIKADLLRREGAI